MPRRSTVSARAYHELVKQRLSAAEYAMFEGDPTLRQRSETSMRFRGTLGECLEHLRGKGWVSAKFVAYSSRPYEFEPIAPLTPDIEHKGTRDWEARRSGRIYAVYEDDETTRARYRLVVVCRKAPADLLPTVPASPPMTVWDRLMQDD
jgi:hypothetical protein